MPKKPPRNNPQSRDGRTVQSAASLLRRISQNAGGAGLGQAVVVGGSLLGRCQAVLPESLRPHLIEVLEKPDEVVLFTDSAVWAGRLKLATGELAGVVAGRRQTVRVMPRGGYRR